MSEINCVCKTHFLSYQGDTSGEHRIQEAFILTITICSKSQIQKVGLPISKSNYSNPGSDIDNDHKLMMAKCNIRLKQMKRTVSKNWCVEELGRHTRRTLIIWKFYWEKIKGRFDEAEDEILGKKKLNPRKL